MSKNLYRTIFNKRLGMLIVVAKATGSQGKTGRGACIGRRLLVGSALACAILGFSATQAWAQTVIDTGLSVFGSVNYGGALTVGESGTGTLLFNISGSSATDTTGTIGDTTTGVGTVVLNIVAGQWTNTSTLTVGNAGTGTVSIGAGSVVTNTSAIVGNSAGGTGTVTVDGAGAQWNSSAALTVGVAGTGTLTVAEAGTASATDGITIADASGSVGAINIGAAVSDPAADAGTLDTPTVTFGAGTGNLVFNHTSDDYVFDPVISGGSLATSSVDVLAGTTIFTANDTYAGLTTIAAAGTLQLGNGGTSGSITSDVTDDGALVFNRSNEMTFAGVISGSGTVNQIGAGTTVLTGQSAYSGTTTVAAGTLAASGSDNVFSAASDYAVANGATLELQATNETVGSLTNKGTVDMGTGASPGKTLTTSGNYTGSGGGTLIMGGALDGSADDVLHVQGNTSGDTTIDYTGKLPAAATTDDGILVVRVDGASTGTFTLETSPLTVGAFTYVLVKGTANPKNWYLQVVTPRGFGGGTGNAAPIPTLNETALALLAALLGLSAAALKRREG